MRATVVILATMILSGAADAAQRTFVSAASGDDANPCSRPLPCRNFAAAVFQTDSGGEVVVLDSGGYGSLTITQSVALVAPAGVHAGITALSGNAVTISASSGDVVILRGLYINGLGGVDGIVFASGRALNVESCVLSGFVSGSGLYGSPAGGLVYVRDTISRLNNFGFYFGSTSLNRATLDFVRADENSFIGIAAYGNAEVTVTRSVAAGNDFGVFAAGLNGVLNIESSTITFSSTGITTAGTTRVSDTMISANQTGIFAYPGAVVLSFGNNRLDGNGTNGGFTETAAQQ